MARTGKKVCYLLAMMFSCPLFGQDYSLPRVLSPNAAEIEKYGKIPVSYFNGLPNINIPLTELQAKDYSLPVYLTYHAGGNKPEQHPGWVGLGWTLHAGGCISRTINGVKDEMSGAEYYWGQVVINTSEVGYYYQCCSNNVLSSSWPSTVINSIINDRDDRDYAPDEFYINTEDIQASFYFTGENQVAIVSKHPVDFTVECQITQESSDSPGLLLFENDINVGNPLKAHRYNYFSRFIVTSSKGVVYYFGGDDSAIEYGVTPYPYNSPSPEWYAVATANTWFLKEIVYPNGEHIVFDYQRDGIPMIRTDQHYGWSFDSLASGSGNTIHEGWTTVADTYRRDSIHISYLVPSYLRSIKSTITQDSLVFNRQITNELKYSTTDDEIRVRVWRRTDWMDPETAGIISKMREKDKYQQLKQIITRKGTISFNYSNNATTRLKLFSVDLPSLASYSFEYNETPLPPYNSKMTDVWGYYNGVNYNRHFWQSLETIRTPNAALMKAEILTKITYPTGGYTRFVYSPHEYCHVAGQFPFDVTSNEATTAGGLRIVRIEDCPESGKVESRTFTYGTSGILAGRHRNYAHGTFRYNELLNLFGHQFTGQAEYSIFSEAALNEISTTEGSHVTYSEVIESEQGRGKTVYRYSNHDTPGCRDESPFYRSNNYDGKVIREPFSSKELSRGNLLSIKQYDETGRLVKEVSNEYNQDTTSFLHSILLHSHNDGYLFGVNGHKIFTYFPALVHRQTKTYSDDGAFISESEDFEYDSYRNLKKTTRSCGNHTEVSATNYPADIPGGIYPAMVAARYLDRPIEQYVIRDGKVVSAYLTTYGSFSDRYLPNAYYKAALGEGCPLSSFNLYAGQEVNPVYKKEVSYIRYDSKNNILLTRNQEKLPTTYVWDARGDKLAAVIVGAIDGTRSLYVRGAVAHTEEENFINANPAEMTFTCDVAGSFSFSFTSIDTTNVISAKLDGNTISTQRIGNGAQGTATAISISAGVHSLQIVGTDLIYLRSHPIVEYPVSGILTITYPKSGVVEGTGIGLDSFFQDFENSTDGVPEFGFESSRGRLHTYTKTIGVIPNRTYILDYMRRYNGKWRYVREYLTPTSSTLTLTVPASQSVPTDHVRFYPADCTAESFTWWPTGELRCMVDGDGLKEMYEYDMLGRLTTVKDTDGNAVKGYVYNYRDQTHEQNSIIETTFTRHNQADSVETVTYYDGLGRETEKVQRGSLIIGGDRVGDAISLMTYDACGRPSSEYLPVAKWGNGGAFNEEAEVSSMASSQYSDGSPYTERVYDGSPLDRVKIEWGAGISWRMQGKGLFHSRLLNDADISSQSLVSFSAGYSGNMEPIVWKGVLVLADGTVRIEQRTEEDGRILSVFTDAFGQVILERRHLSGDSYADTYYCHDEAGRLIAVLPPELSSRLTAASGTVFTFSSSALLQNYGYFYRYDDKGQLIAKKLPGVDWVYYIYDKGGRLIYTQDGNQRLRGEWTFALSDRLGRACLTGTKEITLSPFTDPLGEVNVFVQRNEPTTDMRDYGYLPVNFDLLNADILSVSWYDDYAFLGNMDGIPSAASQTSPTRFDVMAVTDCGDEMYEYGGVGRMTGRMEKILGETDGNQYLWSVLYYDDRGRVVQESHATHRGGWQRTNSGYDFTGHPLTSRTIHHDPTAGDMTERYANTYDAWGRPLTVTHRLDSLQAVVLHDYSYDGIGRLIRDRRNGDADLSTEFTYNIRSWLTDIKVGGNESQGTGETFKQKLYYQNTRSTTPQATVQWSGNISSMDWMAGSDGVTRRYDFEYDGLSRLTGAPYTDDASLPANYSRGYAYDKNGNITQIATATDTTQVTYTGNQLTIGSNNSYDANGNLTKDLERGIVSIQYNLLNLPQSISTGTSGGPGGFVFNTDGRDYLYSSSGVKLQSKAQSPLPLPGHTDTRERQDYVGNLIYDRTSLQKVLFDGGYVEVTGVTKDYRFFVTDHLGNNRLVTDASGSILQTNHYDPYGESLPDGAAAESGNPYKYGGKEYDDNAFAYDFGARHYTSSIPRWTTMDPLAEKYYSISPYAYCAGNPMRYTDPTGKRIEEDSLEEWGRLKQRIENRRDRVQRQINKINAKAKSKGWSSEKLATKIGNKSERLASLNSSIETMGTLEGSTQVYSLSHTKKDENGCVKLNTSTSVIDIRFGRTANFVHEMTHAGQFESGDIAFTNTGDTIFQDVYDEMAAYKAQFGYSPSSVSGIKSITFANTFAAITPLWVQGIIDPTGSQPYAVGGSANTGVIPININSSIATLIQAYPWKAASFIGLPKDFILGNLPNIYYKQ